MIPPNGECRFGLVVATSGPWAWVEVNVRQGCQACQSFGGCSNWLKSVFSPNKAKALIRVKAGALALGQTVRLLGDSERIMKLAILAYGLPLSGLATGLVFGTLMQWHDLVTIGCSLAGCGIGMLAARLAFRRTADPVTVSFCKDHQESS